MVCLYEDDARKLNIALDRMIDKHIIKVSPFVAVVGRRWSTGRPPFYLFRAIYHCAVAVLLVWAGMIKEL